MRPILVFPARKVYLSGGKRYERRCATTSDPRFSRQLKESFDFLFRLLLERKESPLSFPRNFSLFLFFFHPIRTILIKLISNIRTHFTYEINKFNRRCTIVKRNNTKFYIFERNFQIAALPKFSLFCKLIALNSTLFHRENIGMKI